MNGLEVQDENTIDVTDRVTCYEKGKTFECDCGQGIGVKHGRRSVKCANCSATLIDRGWDSREPREHNRNGQTTLEQW